MKKPSEDLFRLIKSLSPSEKRYFKVITASGEGNKSNNYHKLFDAIDEQESYDEGLLLSKYKGQKFVRNLPMAKKYLMESIHKSLCSFHPAKHGDIDVFEKLHTAKLMDEKGLLAIRGKLIRSARGIATKAENTTALLHVVRMESMYCGRNLKEENQAELQQLYEEQQDLLEMLRTDIDLSYLHSLSHALAYQIGAARSAADRGRVRELLKHPVLNDEGRLKTLIHKQMFHNIRSRCYQTLGDYKQSYYHYKISVESYAGRPGVVESNPLFYARLLSNFAQYCLAAQEWKDHYAAVQTLRSLPDNDLRMRKIKFESLHSHELRRNWALGKVEVVYELLPQIEAEFAELGDNIEALMYLYLFYLVLMHLFALQDYDAALDYANRLLSDEKLQGPLAKWVRIIVILIHLEQHNFDVADNGVRSLRRQLRKQNDLPQFESRLLSACLKIGKLGSREEEQRFFRKLKTELEVIVADPQEAQALSYFDVIVWIDARIQGVSMAEVIKGRQDASQGQDKKT